MSFIEEQRRKQIIDATIAVLARHGVAQTSLSRIAAEAGISKSIISYHFDGKDEIFARLFETVSIRIEAAIVPEIESATTSWGRLAAYIGGQLAYMRAHRDELLAIGHIALSHIGTGTTPDYIARTSVEEHELLRGWLLEGQADGSFVAFDADVMAATMSGAIESTLSRWASTPDTDLDLYARELIALFHRAVLGAPN
jgi:AcrR family transcriptional regulator